MSPESPSPSPEAAPKREVAVPVLPAGLGSPIELEAHLLVVVVPNVNSDGGPSRIERIRVGQRGIAERETVLDAAALIPGAYLNSWRNVHHPASGSGGELVVALCHGGQCGGLGPADIEARTTLLRTGDNGATWEMLTTLSGAYWIASWKAEPTEIILYDYPTTEYRQGDRVSRLVRWPSMRPILPPSQPGESWTLGPFYWLMDGRRGGLPEAA